MAEWSKEGGCWVRTSTEVYKAALDLVWLLHANHMAPTVFDAAGVGFDGPRSGQTHGAMQEGQGGEVWRSGGRTGRYRYVVTRVDAVAPAVEWVEMHRYGRRWRRCFTLKSVSDGTEVTERVTIERGLPFRLDLPVVEALSARRVAAIHRWLATPVETREPFPDNAKAPTLRST